MGGRPIRLPVFRAYFAGYRYFRAPLVGYRCPELIAVIGIASTSAVSVGNTVYIWGIYTSTMAVNNSKPVVSTNIDSL